MKTKYCGLQSFTDCQRSAMVNLYDYGASGKLVGQIFGCDKAIVYKAVRSAGCNMRSEGSTRKFALDETFFDTIDTEDKAYWLGFITADGNIRRNMLRVTLQPNDIGHLEKLKVSVSSENPNAVKLLNTGYAHFQANSAYMTSSLTNLGLTENKCHVVKPWDGPTELQHHYWRGCFDGDGCLFKQATMKNGVSRWAVGLAGNEFMVSGFSNYISKYIKCRANVRKLKWGTHSIQYGGNRLIDRILRLLYYDATVWLDRKHKLVCEFYGDLGSYDRPNEGIIHSVSLRHIPEMSGDILGI